MSDDARERILAATVVCLGRYGIAKTTVDDAAREAGVARATVYRHFPDGKDQLIGESITWAVGQFFHELAHAVDDAPDFPTLLEQALMHAHRAVDEHVVLQKVLETEPERLLPQLTQSAPQVQAVLRDYLAEKLPARAAAARRRPAARRGTGWPAWGCRSSSPRAGGTSPTRTSVRHLVRDELLVVDPPARGPRRLIGRRRPAVAPPL